MADNLQPRAMIAPSFVDRMSRLSAGYRLIILLSIALLPLGLLAVIASLQISRSADLERRATVRVASAESARRLGSQIAIDTTALRSAANLLERGGDEATICARTLSALASSFSQPTDFALVTRTGRYVCGSRPQPGSAHPNTSDDTGATLTAEGLTLTLPGATRGFIGVAYYPKAALVATLRPVNFGTEYNLTLSEGDQMLPLIEGFGPARLERRESVMTGVPGTSLTLMFEVHSIPFKPAEMLTVLIPILMWLVAIGVAWLVFNRLVIAPLAQLRADLAGYKPGEIVQPLRKMTIPAREIEDLGNTFQTISRTVAAHEAELAEGLVRQRKLTREVHHRVKNNLQVVSSLINLHARAAKTSDAISAYASIGRRVDALAVVHRNHYAELEENRGVNLRALIGELSANLRASAPGQTTRLAILIDVPTVHVSQDTAIPIAFLVTELIELAMLIDPAAAIRLSVMKLPDQDRASLAVASGALQASDHLNEMVRARYGRVIEGLSRQLRSPIEREDAEGIFRITFPLSPDPSDGAEK